MEFTCKKEIFQDDNSNDSTKTVKYNGSNGTELQTIVQPLNLEIQKSIHESLQSPVECIQLWEAQMKVDIESLKVQVYTYKSELDAATEKLKQRENRLLEAEKINSGLRNQLTITNTKNLQLVGEVEQSKKQKRELNERVNELESERINFFDFIGRLKNTTNLAGAGDATAKDSIISKDQMKHIFARIQSWKVDREEVENGKLLLKNKLSEMLKCSFLKNSNKVSKQHHATKKSTAQMPQSISTTIISASKHASSILNSTPSEAPPRKLKKIDSQLAHVNALEQPNTNHDTSNIGRKSGQNSTERFAKHQRQYDKMQKTTSPTASGAMVRSSLIPTAKMFENKDGQANDYKLYNGMIMTKVSEMKSQQSTEEQNKQMHRNTVL